MGNREGVVVNITGGGQFATIRFMDSSEGLVLRLRGAAKVKALRTRYRAARAEKLLALVKASRR